MAYAHYGRQGILEQDVRLDSRQRGARLERKHKIHLVFGKKLHQLVHLLIEYIKLYARIHLHERDDRLGENRAERVGHTYIERAGKQFLKVVDTVYADFGVVESAQRIRQQQLAGLCEANGVTAAQKQHHAEFILKLPYLLRQRALRYIESLGRIGKA